MEKPKPAPFGFDRPVAASAPGFVANLARLYQHLRNAELLSLNTWLAQPARAAVRLIPLRLKQGINQWMGRPFFDLRFYLRFQPSAALIEGKLIKQLEYQPCRRRQGCRRIALLTPHLGVGGPEQTLLEFARQLDRSQFEIFLIGTHSKDSRLRPEWERSVDHIYDLAKLAPDGMSEQFLFSLPLNWQFDILLMQNSIPAYRVLPALKHRRPAIRIVDILHTADEDWDLFSKALDVADHLDRTIVVSGTGRRRLLDMAVPAEKIRLIRSGVDLARFDPRRFERGRLHRRLGLPASTKIILYAGRLEPNKQPLLLPAIAEELNALLPGGDFHIVVAGDGPERERLYARVKTKGLENRFSLLGHVPDVAELLADIALLVIPAASSGVPLILLEALAMEAPVVACRGSAIEEALPHSRGKLVEAGEYVENRLASAIQELLIDAGRRAEMGRAGRALVEREYSLVRARRQYRELIAELGA